MKQEDEKYSTIHYKNYLDLGKLLNAQSPRSAELQETPAHEEMLFIIVHQAYELWFKQVIHELTSVLAMFEEDGVDEQHVGVIIARLNRVIKIWHLMIEQIKILETMTPLDFLDFRNYLFPASGFQSYQFRQIENLLGLKEVQRVCYYAKPYYSEFSEGKQERLQAIEKGGSIFDALEDWLERTPFIEFGEFDFIEAYSEAVQRMIKKEQAAIMASDYLTEKEKQKRLEVLGNEDSYFKTVLDKEYHQKMIREGQLRMSYDATIAALFINLYRDEPILQLPYQLMTCFVEIDEALTTWRHRHSQMVLRMIGNKVGTGGSPGHEYLSKTARQHHIFKDLANISTLMIPRSELPRLPEEMRRALGFYYTDNK